MPPSPLWVSPTGTIDTLALATGANVTVPVAFGLAYRFRNTFLLILGLLGFHPRDIAVELILCIERQQGASDGGIPAGDIPDVLRARVGKPVTLQFESSPRAEALLGVNPALSKLGDGQNGFVRYGLKLD